MLRRSSFVLIFIEIPCSGFVFTPYVIVYYYYHIYVLLVFVLFLLSFWCPCMTIKVNMQYNGGVLRDIILLTQYYLT